MITVKAPYRYVGGAGILKDAGAHIARLGERAFVLGGKTALSAVKDTLYESLVRHAVFFEIKEFSGYPTDAAIDEGAAFAKNMQADIIIGVGGGRALDTAKAIGQKNGLPVVTVPTIAATCAAWAAVSILYDAQGTFVGAYRLDYSPRLVLLDYGVLANAPARYLCAGIADTIAKWFETKPNLEKSDDLYLKLEIKTAELAMETIEAKAAKVTEEIKSHTASKDFEDMVDCVILLAGLVGSTQSETFFGGFAHPFYNSITRIPETRGRLHGEKISFGLLTQAVIEQKTEAEITRLIALLRSLGQPVTLAELGITENIEEKVRLIADGVAGCLVFYKVPDHALTSEEIADAILLADRLGQTAQGV